MTVRSLIERLQVVCRTPQNTEKIPGVPTKNTPLSLEESTLGTPRTPRTPKKVEGQSENQKSPPDWAPPAPDPAKPLPKFHIAQPWNAADKAYQAHHWNCDACKAYARSNGHSDRCATGQQLHDLYERAFEAGKVSQ